MADQNAQGGRHFLVCGDTVIADENGVAPNAEEVLDAIFCRGMAQSMRAQGEPVPQHILDGERRAGPERPPPAFAFAARAKLKVRLGDMTVVGDTRYRVVGISRWGDSVTLEWSTYDGSSSSRHSQQDDGQLVPVPQLWSDRPLKDWQRKLFAEKEAQWERWAAELKVQQG